MKKLTLMLGVMLIAGATFAGTGDKGKKACCKKEAKKECCKKGSKECKKEAKAEAEKA